jgi:hypothetical protein
MTPHQGNTRQFRSPLLLALAGYPIVALAACASVGPFVPDKTDKIPPPQAREGARADDVFMRAPWELWRVPNGTARYHRGTFMLLPDETESFKASEVSIYAADGSDVRLDYSSVDLGRGSQSSESISVFVYRAPDDLEREWKSVTERMGRKWPGATAAEPFPVPAYHPLKTKQMAMIAPARTGDNTNATFVQATLFHQGEWAVRYEITCPAVDVGVAREKTRTFLRSIRARERAAGTE